MMKEEIESVLKADSNKKYEYFLKNVAHYEEVWSLKNEEGWVISGLGEDDFFPVWAKKEFAEICISEEWEDCHAESISLEDFLEAWIDGLKKDNIKIAVMWHNGKGIDVDLDRLREDIEEELEKYE